MLLRWLRHRSGLVLPYVAVVVVVPPALPSCLVVASPAWPLLAAMRNQLTELGFQLGGASVLHGDNTASIDAARHPGKHRSALRHLELHAFAIRDLIREEHVRLQWVDTKSNPADLLTKAVPSKALFDKFAKLIMGAVDDTAKVFLLSLRSVLVKGRRRM